MANLTKDGSLMTPSEVARAFDDVSSCGGH
jgi:hypothetical protein